MTVGAAMKKTELPMAALALRIPASENYIDGVRLRRKPTL